MTPMPPEIARTLTAYRQIMGKVQVLLAKQRIAIPALSALALAFIGDQKMQVREARRLGFIPSTNQYQTIAKLHAAGFVRCSDERGKHISVELTPKGLELATAVRQVLSKKDAVSLEGVE